MGWRGCLRTSKTSGVNKNLFPIEGLKKRQIFSIKNGMEEKGNPEEGKGALGEGISVSGGRGSYLQL